MKNKISSILFGFILLLGATPAMADTYGDVTEKLRTLNPAKIIEAHNTVKLQPLTPEYRFFYAITSLLNEVVAEDGGGTTTIAEIMREYGLEFGTKIGFINHIMSGETDLFKTSTKSLEDFRTFMETWKANIQTSIGYLNQVGTNFSYVMTLSDGTEIELDYTDVLLVKSGLQALYCYIEVMDAHNMDATIADLQDPNAFESLISGNSFLKYRANSGDQLASAKSWAQDALGTFKSMLQRADAEGATPVGAIETFVVKSSAIPNVITAADHAIENLMFGSPFDINSGAFGEIDFNVVFDGLLSVAQMAPQFGRGGVVHSTMGHLLGDDATLNGMFPRATQVSWNKQLVSRLKMFPYTLEYGSGEPLTDPNTMQLGGFNNVFFGQFNWEQWGIGANGWGYGIYMNIAGSTLYVGGQPTTYDGTSYHIATDDKLVTQYKNDAGALEITYFKNGNISVATDMVVPVKVSAIYSLNGNFRRKEITLDASDSGKKNILFRQSGTPSTSGSMIVAPIINLLLQ